MEDGSRVLPETFIEPYTTAGCISFDGVVYTQRLGQFGSQLPNFLSWNYFPPLYNQSAHCSFPPYPHWEQYYWPSVTGPAVLSPWHISRANVQVALTPDVYDGNPGDDFGGGFGFEDGQIWGSGSPQFRPGRASSTCQGYPFREIDSPFDQGDGNDDVQLCNPDPFCTTADSQSPNVSLLRLSEPYIPDTHPNSPFEHRPDQTAEAQESSGFQQSLETETAIEQGSGSRVKLISSKEWPCDRDGCDKSYGRPQEVRRHVREQHETSPECLICGITWKRPEMIRRHLLKEHQDRFTEEQRQTICQLQGLNNTIDFLNEWDATN